METSKTLLWAASEADLLAIKVGLSAVKTAGGRALEVWTALQKGKA